MKAIKPAVFPWFDYAKYTFSLGLQRDRQAWLSGHSASEFDPESKHIVVKGGMADQTRTAYGKIEAILDAAGMTLGDATRIVEYVTAAGIDDYAECEAVRRELLGAHRPAVCTVVVNRLLRPAALIEIEVTADASVAPDDVVYLSSVTGDGDNLMTQTASAFEKARRSLEAVGLSLSNIVKTVDYTTPATLGDYKRTGRIREGVLGPTYPGAAGILLSRLQRPDVLVSLDIIASRQPLEVIDPGWDRYEKLTYSPAVKAGTMLFMSGQAALDPATERAMFGGDIVAQAEYTYSNIIAVLKAAGGGPENLVKTIEYVTPSGLERYRDVAKVRQRMLIEPFPASTGAVCDALLRPEFLIEVDPLAVLS